MSGSQKITARLAEAAQWLRVHPRGAAAIGAGAVTLSLGMALVAFGVGRAPDDRPIALSSALPSAAPSPSAEASPTASMVRPTATPDASTPPSTPPPASSATPEPAASIPPMSVDPYPSFPGYADSEPLDFQPILVIRATTSLRDAPQSTANEVATLSPGERVGQIGAPIAGEGMRWVEVRQGTRSGWVSLGTNGDAVARVTNEAVALVRPVLASSNGEAYSEWETMLVFPNGDERLLTRERLRFGPSAWDWEGTRLAAVDDGQRVVIVDGEGSRTEIGPGLYPRWSPDGSQLAYFSADERQVLISDGVGVGAPVFDAPGLIVGMDWSPDGTRIAVLAHECANCDGFAAAVFLIDVIRGEATTFTSGHNLGGCGARYPAWYPDGSAIRFTRSVVTSESRSMGWVQVATESGAVEPVPGGETCTMAWSPDGAFAVAARSEGVSAFRADGSDPALLVSWGDAPELFEAAWSPDGLQVSFRTSCDDCLRNSHVIVSAVGGGMIEVPADSYAWQPSLQAIGD